LELFDRGFFKLVSLNNSNQIGECVSTTSNIFDEILSKPYNVSDEQRAAIISESKYTRVIAGAGAGKTETITRRIAYLLLVKGIEPRSIVAFTFTEKAAQSMKSRIYQRVEQVAGPSATARLGEMYIGTIHAYAKSVLDNYFGYSNYNVLDSNQEIAYVMRHGWGLSLDAFGRNYSMRISNFLRTLGMVQSELLSSSILSKQASDFYHSYRKYMDLLEENKLLTFATMISRTVEHLEEKPETLSHVEYLIVDEFQDINHAQNEFIRLIAGEDGIFVVGDPRQSIYQWRGSDQKYFELFSETYPETKAVNTNENWRSGKKIVLNANLFSDSFTKLSVDHMNPTRDETGYVGFAKLKNNHEEATWIADQIESIVAEGNTTYSDIGILARSVSTAAGLLINEFKRRRIPYVVGGKIGLFKRDEAQALGRIFAWFYEKGFWMEDPYGFSERIEEDDLITTALVYWGQSHLHQIPNDVESKLRKIKENVTNKNPQQKYQNFSELYQEVLLALGFEELEYTDRNDAAVMANLGRFNSLLTDYETANRYGGRSVRWQRELSGLCWYMNSHAMKAYEEQPSDDIRNIDAVQVMTIHQSKGLEWPVVFLFSLTGTRFPPRSMGRRQLWCGIPRTLFDAEKYEGSLEDERRLFYVAITRPRDALILSYFEKMSRRVGRSILLDDIDWLQIDEVETDDLPKIKVDSNARGDEIQTFTAGELIQYNICPHMYLLRNLWGYQPGLSPRLGFGNALHYCLRRTGELIKEGKYSVRSALGRAIHDGFHMPFVGGTVLEDFKNSASRALIDFSTQYESDLTRIEEVEYRLEYPIQGATILGKVDVILRDGNNLEVRDYKSMSKDDDPDDNRTHEEAEIQVRLYSLGLMSMDKKVTDGSVAYLGNARVEPVNVDSKSLDETREYAEQSVQRIVNRDFNPCSGTSCGRCDFIGICRWRSNTDEN
jgi:DNA helicase II / ATP-dependent DNA helicase PcrA